MKWCLSVPSTTPQPLQVASNFSHETSWIILFLLNTGKDFCLWLDTHLRSPLDDKYLQVWTCWWEWGEAGVKSNCSVLVLRLSTIRLIVHIPSVLHLLHVIQSHYSKVPELWQITVTCKSRKAIYLGNYSAPLLQCLLFVRQQDKLQISEYYSLYRLYSGLQQTPEEWGTVVNQFIRWTSEMSCEGEKKIFIFSVFRISAC